MGNELQADAVAATASHESLRVSRRVRFTQDLCALGLKHKNIYLKLSAHFRVSSQEAPRTDLQPRFDAAVDAFGADRLMWGSDFPFVQLNGGQRASLEAVRGFARNLPQEAQDALLGGTARRLFRLP